MAKKKNISPDMQAFMRELIKESLRDWFKKEKWVRISSSGNIAGDCGTSKNKKNPDRCLPKSKAQSLTKGQRAATASKKKKAGSKGKTVVKNTKKATVTKEAFTPSPLQKLVNEYLFLITMNFIHIEKTGKSQKDVEELVKMIKHTKSDTDKLKDLSKVQLEKNRNSILQRIHDMLNYIISRMKAHMRPEEYEKRRGRLKQLLTLYKQAAKTQENYTGNEVKVTKEDLTNLVVGMIHEINSDNKEVNFGYDLQAIQAVVDHLKSKYKEGIDYELHIGRGDDLPNAITIKNTSLQKDYDLNDMLNVAQSDEDRYDAYTDDDLNEEKDDRCTRIAKSKYDTWPSAYASGAVVRCRRGDIWKNDK